MLTHVCCFVPVQAYKLYDYPEKKRCCPSAEEFKAHSTSLIAQLSIFTQMAAVPIDPSDLKYRATHEGAIKERPSYLLVDYATVIPAPALLCTGKQQT